MKATVPSSTFCRGFPRDELNLARSAQSHVHSAALNSRRYERWNPVHPTIGSFWGVGIGIGCGIVWGPGFGHEVVGYVGAGCGAGFNVGINFLGVGIGFPSNYLLTAPYNAFLAAKKGSLSIMEDSCGGNRSDTSSTQKSRGAIFSGFNVRDLPDVRSMLVSNTKHMTDCFHKVSGGVFLLDRGPKSKLENP